MESHVFSPRAHGWPHVTPGTAKAFMTVTLRLGSMLLLDLSPVATLRREILIRFGVPALIDILADNLCQLPRECLAKANSVDAAEATPLVSEVTSPTSETGQVRILLVRCI